jgi:hypothetical protein
MLYMDLHNKLINLEIFTLLLNISVGKFNKI